jgi:hypothetical protein
MTDKNIEERLKEAEQILSMAEAAPGYITTDRLTAAGFFLLGEVRRLGELEAKILGLMKETSDEITELNADYEAASEADCDFEVFERIERLIGRSHAQLKILNKLLA